MHSKFRHKIAANIVELRRDLGTDDANEYAERMVDSVSDEDWTELIKDIQRIKSDDESS